MHTSGRSLIMTSMSQCSSRCHASQGKKKTAHGGDFEQRPKLASTATILAYSWYDCRPPTTPAVHESQKMLRKAGNASRGGPSFAFERVALKATFDWKPYAVMLSSRTDSIQKLKTMHRLFQIRYCRRVYVISRCLTRGQVRFHRWCGGLRKRIMSHGELQIVTYR